MKRRNRGDPADVRRGRRVLVMGLGLHGGGVGTAAFFAQRGEHVLVTDLRTRRELAPSLRALARFKNIRYVLGRHRPGDFRAADLIVKNPGVRRDHPLLKDAVRRGIPVTSDVAIFFKCCPGTIIGVSGTRGKSTTTYLVWKMLKKKYPRARYGGNIRRSVLAMLPAIRPGDPVVLELSSFQLMDLNAERISPPVAALTNIMRDHLNWHKNMAEYRGAKAALFGHQRRDGVLFIPARVPALARLARTAPGRVRRAPLASSLRGIVDRNLGPHYRASAALAAAVARFYGVPQDAIASVLRKFKGLESREELTATVRGVRYVNDTTATTPDAAVAAIRRFRSRAGKKHRLILIAGGQDKKLDFRPMLREIRTSVDALIMLPGSATSRMMPALKKIGRMVVETAPSMTRAVRAARRAAAPGDWVVLSPGAASFGLFLNEFDRGAKFRRAVQAMRRPERRK